VWDTTQHYIKKVREYNGKHDKLLAAKLTYFTGGHPGIIAKHLKTLVENSFADIEEFVLKFHQEIVDQDICPILEKVQKSVQNQNKELFATFEELCIFRKLGKSWFLQPLVEEGIIKWEGKDWDNLAQQLEENRLLQREGGILRDDIYRKLLSLKVISNIPNQKYGEIILAGRKLYEFEYKGDGPTHSKRADAAIEWIYLNIFMDYYIAKKSGQSLADLFTKCANDVLQYFENFYGDRYSDEKEDFLEKLRQDKEFEFLINYCCMEGDEFNLLCYSNLLQKIRSNREGNKQI